MDKYPGYTALLPPRVRYDKELPATAKLLYAEITAMTDVTGFCWASNRYLGELTGVGKDRASRLVAQLAERGYVEVDVLRGEQNEIRERRIFVTDLGLMRLPPPVKNNDTPIGENNDTPIGENTGRAHIKKNDKSLEHNPPIVPPRGTRAHKTAPDWKPEEFAKLWIWYPVGTVEGHARRGNKQKAIRAWDRLQPSYELIGVIAEALARQAASDAWQEGVGIPHLSTYLNNWGWEGWEEAEDDG